MNNGFKSTIIGFNKPRGVICTHKDEKNRVKVYDFIPKKLFKESGGKIHSIGRLDYNSQGLLLLTNDKKIKSYFENPKSKILRVYKVKVQGVLEKKHIIRILAGITVNNILYDVKSLDLLSKTKTYTWIKVSLDKGKNQHIRKIFLRLKMSVNKLIRIQYGPYKLANLKSGKLKVLSKNHYKKCI